MDEVILEIQISVDLAQEMGMATYIIYGDTEESENNLVVLSFREAESASEAFEKWKESETFRAQKGILTSNEIRVCEMGARNYFFL